MASAPSVVACAAIALLALAPPPAGADHPVIPLNVLDRVPVDGNTYAAWKIHFPGSHAFGLGVGASVTLPGDAGAVALTWHVTPVGSSSLGGALMSIVTFDTAANTVSVSAAGLTTLETTTYEGPEGTIFGFQTAMRDASPEGMPAGDYYVVAIIGEDGSPFTGELRLLSDDSVLLERASGPAFYYRERNFPALVNAAVDMNDERYRSIELGLVEASATSRMFATFYHQEMMPAPIWFDETEGFWVEGPGIYDPLRGAQHGAEWLLNDCEEDIVAFCAWTATEPALDGQFGSSFAVSNGVAGDYRFRVDHWNAIESVHWPFDAPTPIVALLGADVELD